MWIRGRRSRPADWTVRRVERAHRRQHRLQRRVRRFTRLLETHGDPRDRNVRHARRGLAGYARSRRRVHRKVAVLTPLLPVWLSSEIRQSTLPPRRRRLAHALVWSLTATTVALAINGIDGGRAPPAARSGLGKFVPGISATGWPPPTKSARPARVARVIDGDTVALEGTAVGRASSGGRSSRLIGIDTPEVHGRTDCYGSHASAFTKQHLEGRDVMVDFDVQTTDRYGRALVYVWTLNGRLFNARLAAEGYAMQMTIPPNVRYAGLFGDLVREARSDGRGLWSACSVRP